MKTTSYISLKKFFRLIVVTIVLDFLWGTTALAGTVTVTAATGGSAISADGTGGTYTTLTGPILKESAVGDITTGTIILNAPSGFIFNTGAPVTATVSPKGNGVLTLSSSTATPTTTTITFTVTGVSSGVKISTITFSSIQVRPSAGTPLASGNITKTGTSSFTASSTNYGTLTEVAGTITKLVVTLPGQTFTAGSGNSGIVTAQTAGVTFNITSLTATDQFFNIVTSYSGTKMISYSGPGGSPTYPPSVSFTIGQSTTTLATTLKKAQTTTITASDGTTTGPASSPLTVNAGTFTKLQLLVPGETAAPGTSSGKTGTPTAQTAGTAFTVTVNAVDSNWNIISASVDVVSITSSDVNATLPTNAALVGGTQTFNVTLKTAGTATVTASDITNGLITANTSPSITVNPGAATKLTIQTQPSATATAGGAFAQQPVIRIEDAFGNLRTSDNTTVVTATRGTGTAALQGTTTATASGGVATFTNLSYNKAETITIVFSSGGLTSATSNNIVVNPGAISKLIVTLPGETFTAISGNSGTVTNQTAGISFNISSITAADQFSNIVTSYSGAKTISYSGPGGSPTYTTSVSFTSGQSTTTLATTLKKAETTTITASDGTTTGPASSSLTVNADVFTKLQLLVPGETAAPGTATGKTGTPTAQTAKTPFTVTVNAVDANWNLVSLTHMVHITSSDANATLPADAALAAGTKNFSVTLNTGGTTATVTASDITDPTKTANTSPSITVNRATTTWKSNATDSLWNNAANWTNGVPDSTTNVVISSNTPTPHVPVTNAHCFNLTLNTGGAIAYDNCGGTLFVHGQMTLANGSTFNLGTCTPPNQLIFISNSTITNGGNFIAGNGTIDLKGSSWSNLSGSNFNPGTSTAIFDGTSSQTLSGNITFYNLQVNTNGTLTLSGNVTVTNNATISSGSTVNIPSGSSFTVTGTFTNNGTLTGSGTISVPAGAAASVTATAGASQSATVNTAFSTALQATVKDQFNNLVSGVVVTFTSPASGASGTFANGKDTTSAVTNGSGVATATTFTANTVAGSYTVTATVGALPVANYSLTNTAGALATITVTPSPVSVTAGKTQQFAAAGADQFGNSVSISPAWTTNAGTVNGSGLLTASTTAASGKSVTATVGNISGSATVNIVAGILHHFTVGNVSTQTAGQAFSITITAQDVYNNIVTSFASTVSLSVDSGSISPTSSNSFLNGSITQSITLTNAGARTVTVSDGSGHSGSVTITINPGSVTQVALSVVSKTITSGSTTTLTATVKDANNNIVTTYAGTVIFSVVSGSTGSGTFGSVSLSNGIASVSFKGTTAGIVKLVGTATASSPNINSDTMAVVVNPGAAASISLVSGTNQSAVIKTALAKAFVVVIKDSAGNGVPGVIVKFAIDTIPSGAIGQSLNVTNGATDAKGQDSTVLTLGNKIGVYTVRATSGALVGSSVTFQATAIHGPAAVLSTVSGDSQTTFVNTTLKAPLVVKVADSSGNPVPRVAVTFAIDSIPASAAGQSLSATSVLTDTNGTSSAVLTTGDKVGIYRVKATVTGLSGSPVVFTVTVKGTPPSFVGAKDTLIAIRGVPFEYKLTASGTSGAVLQFSLLLGPPWLQLNTVSGVLSGTPGVNNVGISLLIVRVADNFGLSATDTFYVRVNIPVSVEQVGSGIPTEFQLFQNYPNPFNPVTAIRFGVPKRQRVVLVVYDIVGREVVRLADGEFEPGYYNVTWDGKDGSGVQVASGVYFYRFHSESFHSVKKMVLMK